MAKLVTLDISNLSGNPVTAQTNINSNNAAIEAALENTLSRDGTTPNAMSAAIDMNSYKVTNLAEPTADGDAVTKAYADNVVATSLPTQTGNSGKFLTTDGSDASWGTPAGGAASIPSANNEQLNSITSDINTTADKEDGYYCWNNFASRPVWALGTGAETVWVYADGTVAHTPS